MRLRSSASGEGTTGLDAYVARKKEGQKHIYYLAGECSVFYGCFGLRGLWVWAVVKAEGQKHMGGELWEEGGAHPE